MAVLTDIGKDIDDTLALLYLAALHQRGMLSLELVVTTGGCAERRARAARALLGGIGTRVIPGSPVPLRPTKQHLKRWARSPIITNCIDADAEGAQAANDGNGDGNGGAVALRELAVQHGSSLVILCIAGVTDLALAMNATQEDSVAQEETNLIKADAGPFGKIGGLILQGHVTTGGGAPEPDQRAYNFRDDIWAARYVFDALRGSPVPRIVLGKFAAYAGRLDTDAFQRMDKSANCQWGLMDTALRGIEALHERLPRVFTRVFGVSAQGWDSKRDGLVSLPFVSCPYDAYAAVLLTRDAQRLLQLRPCGDGVWAVGNSAKGSHGDVCKGGYEHPDVIDGDDLAKHVVDTICSLKV